MKIVSTALFFLISLFFINILHAQKIHVSGSIVTPDKEPVVGASITIGQGLHYITNEKGYFSFSVSSGSVNIDVSSLGYESLTLQLELTTDSSIIITMTEQSYSLDEVEVLGTNKDLFGIQQGAMRLTRISPEISTLLPGIGGEPDFLKSIQLLPGVSTTNEGTSSLIVRGGGADQNLILLDNNILFNPNHIFGLLSTINPNAIKYASLYKGPFPSAFGGRLASVIDIQLKDGNLEKWKGNFSLGTVTSSFNLDGPLSKVKGISMAMSLRSSYLGLFAIPARLNFKKKFVAAYTNYFLYDGHIKISKTWSPGHTLNMSIYHNRDSYRYRSKNFFNNILDESRFNYSWGNTTVGLNYTRPVKNKIYWRNSLSFSAYNNSLNYRDDLTIYLQGSFNTVKESSIYQNTSGLFQLLAKSNMDAQLTSRHRIKSGIEASVYGFAPFDRTFNFESAFTNFNESNSTRFNNQEIVLFHEHHYQITPSTELMAGVRWTAFGDFYGIENIEPRISVSQQLLKNIKLNLAYARMRQYIHQVNSAGNFIQNDLWVPSDDLIRPAASDIFTIGANYAKNGSPWQFSLDFYHKQSANLLLPSASFVLSGLGDPDYRNYIYKGGQGKSYGMELFASGNFKKLSFNIAYTLSKTLVQFDGIRQNELFNSPIDRPHIIDISSIYMHSKKWTFSFQFNFSSGAPYTKPVGVFITPTGSVIFDLSQINNARLPDYHRLDLNAIYSWNGRRHGKLHSLTLSIRNAYNRRNINNLIPGRAEFQADGEPVKDLKLNPVYGIPIIPGIHFTRQF